MTSTISTKIALPMDSTMPWGDGETAEVLLSHARIRTLAALRDISHIFVGVDTLWGVGPQSNPILEVIATFSPFKEEENISINDPGLLNTIGNIFVDSMHEYWVNCQRSAYLSINIQSFKENWV